MKDLRDYKPVCDFLLDTSIYDQLEEVAKNHHVPVERVDEFLQLTDAVVKGQLSLEKMPEFVQKAFGVEDSAAKSFAADLAGYALLPLENYLPRITEVITGWGGDVTAYPKTRVGKETTSPDHFVEDLLVRLDLNIPDSLKQRFVYLATGYLTGERNKESTKRILMRKLNIGGLEFTEPMTDSFFEVLDRERTHFDLSKNGDEQPKNVVSEPPVEVEDQQAAAGKEVSNTRVSKQEEEELGEEKSSPFLPMITPLPVVSPNNRSVPDHGIVLQKKSFMTREQLLEKIRSLTLDLPKNTVKLAKASKIAAKQTFGNDNDRLKNLTPEKKTKQQVEQEVNMILAPVVELFREKGLKSVAFRDAVVRFLKEERTAEQTKEQLQQHHGFTAQEADRIIGVFARAKALKDEHAPPKIQLLGKKTPVSTEQPLIVPSEPEKAETHALATTVPIISGLDLFEDEEEEVKQHKQKLQRAVGGKKQEPPQEQVDHLLVPAVQVFKKNHIEKKTFDEIAGAHIRGIRESRQTEALLKDRAHLNEKHRLVVIRALNAAREVAQGTVKKEQAVDGAGDLAQKERAVLNRRHAAVTGTVPKEGVHPVLPTARVSAARTKEEELALQHGAIADEEIISAQSASKPKRARAKVTKKSVPTTSKKVTDVTYTRRLAGPVEEIGKMTVADFRRLSSDPKEAVRKIFDKLALLELTSYEERIAGVRAWRKSGVNQLYLEMSREALKTGKSVAEIAADRRNNGKESLSPKEVQAVVDLNARIKF